MVTRIGHVGIRVRDLERSILFAEQILGLRVSEHTAGVAYLTCNQRHHELVLIAGEETGCDHIGLEVSDEATLDSLIGQLEREGFVVTADTTEAALAAAARFVGPGGFVFELFCGMDCNEPNTYDTVGVRPRKFEHVTIKSANKPEMEDFLQRLLGFRLSDRSGDSIAWLRCSAEHHGMSVISANVDALQHYAWQIDDWAVIRTVGDRLMDNGRTFLWGPGHHGIGDNYFCYFNDDDGIIVEYSAYMQRIEDEARYEPRIWPDEPLSVNRWGNPPPPEEFLAGGVPALPPRTAAAA
jgi:catechol 2,3-dioxygenase-like lactoylglutathione lyase family enzyme